MAKARVIAKYFLSLDTDHSVFTTNLVNRNGRTFYDGNARLNKFLHLAFNIYLAKNEVPLFDDALLAYDNGGVVADVQENYALLLKADKSVNDVPENIKDYLNRFYTIFKDASLDELIELSHEDNAWGDKCMYHQRKDQQKMDSLSRIAEYKAQYEDIIYILDSVTLDA